MRFLFISIISFALMTSVAEAQSSLLPTSSPGFASTEDARSFAEICNKVRMQKRDDFDFSDMEERLLCGDRKNDVIGQPWAEIPPNQAAYFLKGFLQSRAYHSPEFIQDGDVLYVRPGSRSRLKRFRITGGPETWNPPKRRLVEGEPLTPSLLNDLQGWALSQIKDEGYACAAANAQADPLTGEVLIELNTGELKRILSLEEVGDPGLASRALDRYNAFRIGDVYREKLLTLTRRRTNDSGILQTLTLKTKCVPGGVQITRDVGLGPSRTFRVGIGANNDEGAILRSSIRRTRIGESASSAELTARISYLPKGTDSPNLQEVTANYRWFYSKGEGRSYIEPSINFLHEANPATDSQRLNPQVVHGWNKEFGDGNLETRMGPAFLSSKTFRPRTAGKADLFYGLFTTRWNSHDFEYFMTSPRDGEMLDAQVLVTDPSLNADFRAQKIQIQGQKLWNIFRYDPPLLILGARFNISSVFSSDDGLLERLPVEWLSYLGGESTLRGFEAQSVRKSGALSAASVGLETRFHKVVWRRADLFAFLDAGLMGDKNFGLTTPYLMSPGAGVRWESPVGVVRVYLAQRFALNERPDAASVGKEYRFGFTFGEEF